MDILQIIVLALVQGLTEFLPISSSAHLILVPYLTDWPDQGLAFDVAVHVGTLTAVVIYFRKEINKMFFAWFASLAGRHSEDSKLAWAVLIGTIPVGLAGLIFKDVTAAQHFSKCSSCSANCRLVNLPSSISFTVSLSKLPTIIRT